LEDRSVADFAALRANLEAARSHALDAASASGWERVTKRPRGAAGRGALPISRPNAEVVGEKMATLGECVIHAAAAVTQILEYAWKGQWGIFRPECEPAGQEAVVPRAVCIDPHDRMPTDGRKSREVVASHDNDALAPVAWQFGEGELGWLRDCQAFVATVVALLVSHYVRQFRYFLYAMMGSVALLLLALSSYPFEPHRLLLSCSWVVVGSVVGIGVWIFIKLDRNTVMSQLSGTDPGKVTFNGALLLRATAWVLLPLLGVAATTYPDIANLLFRLVDPFLRSLR
jgi:hypothetical protein